jgi:hypothetical protein
MVKRLGDAKEPHRGQGMGGPQDRIKGVAGAVPLPPLLAQRRLPVVGRLAHGGL